jgi:hypothetical protein
MSSSYSPDLRFELIANGEQSGVWGNTTNNNIGTLVEQAIAGTASVVVTTTNQALSVYNGVSDQSRNAIISLSTLTGAPFNVFIPPVSKLYVFVNTSSYAATVYASTVAGNTTAAGSGVSLAANSKSFVYCDGTNVVDAINHVSGNFFTEGNLQVSGTTTLGGNPTLALQAATKQYVDSAIASGFPSGGIVMWSGLISAIPSGWYLCNGANGTPDLRDRFIVGAGSSYAVNATGGSADSTLPSHTHTYSGNTNNAGSHHHPLWGGSAVGNTKGLREAGAVVISAGDRNTSMAFYDTLTSGQQIIDDNGNHNHSFSGTTTSSGVTPTGTNLPPYFALAYIMKA